MNELAIIQKYQAIITLAESVSLSVKMTDKVFILSGIPYEVPIHFKTLDAIINFLSGYTIGMRT